MCLENWNAEVAKNAEKWANRCTLSHSSRRQRKVSFANCGENLFMSSAPLPWSHIIQVFYDEVKNFKYGVGDIRANSKTGHYTQLVWATSHEIGCALAHCPHKRLSYFYVCHYCPEGNNINTKKTPYKKGKPCGDCPNHCDNGLCTGLQDSKPACTDSDPRKRPAGRRQVKTAAGRSGAKAHAAPAVQPAALIF
ncbi:serotriflin-like [Ictidomys tridecemlineatus]|nr:serotriflin-like [Ictidomys tridecemlineatus]